MNEPDAGIIRLKTVDSTNAYLSRMGREGAAEGTVCVAEHQTAGKGRMDRTWHSPAGQGLWMSILLRPILSTKDIGLLSLCAALAVSDALRSEAGTLTEIKWPNDLVCRGKKICGILSTCCMQPDETYFTVIGMGINLKKNAYPEDLKERATSVEEENGNPDMDSLINACRNRLLHYKCLLENGQKAELIQMITERCVTLGKRIKLTGMTEAMTGIAESVGPDGELIIIADDGHRERIVCGDISVRGVMGYV